MKIADLFEHDIEEARAGGAKSTRAASQAAGQMLGKNIASGLPAADAQAGVQALQKQFQQPTANTDLQQRLAGYKAGKQAATKAAAAPGTAPAPTTTPAPTTAVVPATTEPATNATLTPTDTGYAADDPTLGQPAPAKQPTDWNKVAGTLGKFSKGVGAVAAIPQGIGRAVKKGYQAGVNAIGGPGPGEAPAPAGGVMNALGGTYQGGGAGGSAGGGDEIADLRARLQAMDNRLRRIGAE